MNARVLEIPLSRGLMALVDEADFAFVTSFGKWYADRSDQTFYARKNYWSDGRSKSLRMHRVITGWSYVDHVNGNGLDNRRSNLRPATGTQNAQNRGMRSDNTSGYKGVRRLKSGNWTAVIWIDGRQRHLGTYDSPISAALSYDAAARELFGEFARPNFPTDPRDLKDAS